MEIKQEIAQIIAVLPEETLEEVLVYLRQVEKSAPAKIRLSTHLTSILVEDREVLGKLAK